MMPSRRAARLALFLVVVALGLAACSRSVELLGGLGETDANEIAAELARSQIDSDKSSNKRGFSIGVASDKFSQAVDVIQRAGLPRSSHSRLGEIFKKDGMISTPLEERGRYLFGLSQELERTLSEIDGVVTARVHIVLPERVAPGEPITPSSAAVFIKHRAGVSLDLLEYSIREMVAASIPGLARQGPDKIAVVMIPAMESQQGRPRGAVGMDSRVKSAEDRVETPLKAKEAMASARQSMAAEAARRDEQESSSRWRWVAMAIVLAAAALGAYLWWSRLGQVAQAGPAST